ncbi:hypothetical protein HDK64DRAFT_129672 [Phyllosticta capitalensis]|uniref:Uncharacterized protein n=1 Tax=Phyllosticta capitalensis TaxID=121624 RepID=A0ABR1YGM5_9PEZI
MANCSSQQRTNQNQKPTVSNATTAVRVLIRGARRPAICPLARFFSINYSIMTEQRGAGRRSLVCNGNAGKDMGCFVWFLFWSGVGIGVGGRAGWEASERASGQANDTRAGLGWIFPFLLLLPPVLFYRNLFLAVCLAVSFCSSSCCFFNPPTPTHPPFFFLHSVLSPRRPRCLAWLGLVIGPVCEV